MTGLDSLSADLYRSLVAFLPELMLVATIVLLLLARVFERGARLPIARWALYGTLLALGLAAWQLAVDVQRVQQPEIFSGLLRYDSFTAFFRVFLLLFVVLVVWLTRLTGIPDREDSPDFYTLLLGATLGMLLMASANHLLMVFIAVEMASVPSFVMAGFLKGRRLSSEAALKYVVYGAGAAGVMLYGISLLVGLFGTGHLPSLGSELANTFRNASDPATGEFGAPLGTVALAMLMLLVGVLFKLAAVPFHFWCPDVFEGAATEVAAFLSVASKGAALALLVRLAVALGGAGNGLDPGQRPGLSMTEDAGAAVGQLQLWLAGTIAVLAAVTATFGNLAAYAQTNLKRLLAYSTIAHAGYMMMPVAAALVMADPSPAIQSLLFYLAVYLFMNLGAFAVVAFIRNEIGSEDLGDYKGLWQMCPGLAVCMAIFLLSLTGIPPLAGFFAKFYIFAVLFEAGSAHSGMYVLLVVAAINTVISLFYYVKVLRVMIMEPAPGGPAPVRLPLGSPAGIYSLLMSLPVLLLGLWGGVFVVAGNVARTLLSR